MEDDADKSENRLATAISGLLRASLRADDQLKDAKSILLESERKYEDIARKHNNLDAESMRANERAVNEEKAMAREETYQKQIRELMLRLKAAETQAENSEMNIQRLNIRIDQIEDELIHEKLKIKAISDDVDGTFKQMAYI